MIRKKTKRSCWDIGYYERLCSLRRLRDLCLASNNVRFKRKTIGDFPEIQYMQYVGHYTSTLDITLEDGMTFFTSSRYIRYPETMEDVMCRKLYSYLSRKFRGMPIIDD